MPVGVKQFMTQGVPVVAPETDLAEAARRLQAAPGGILAVCEGGRLIGTLSIGQLSARPADLARRPRVADVLQPDLSYCFEDTEVGEAERLMRENGLDRLIVLDRRGRTVGSLALAGISQQRAV